MSFIRRFENDANRKNLNERNLFVNRRSFDAVNYWNQANNRNFIITGGNNYQRVEMLVQAIESIARREEYNTYPVIVLNGCKDFENMAIARAKKQTMGRLYVSSPEYKTYNPLYKMPIENIYSLIQEAARAKGYSDIDMIGEYIKSICVVLESIKDISLINILNILRNDNRNLLACTKRNGLSRDIQNSFINSERTQMNVKAIMSELYDAFYDIYLPQSEINICTLAKHQGINLIWSESKNRRFFDMEIAAELNMLISRGVKFTLILNNVILSKDSALIDMIRMANENSNINLGLCYDDVVSWNSGFKEKMNVLTNTPSLLVINDDNWHEPDLKVILNEFGEYRFKEYTDVLSTGEGFFHVPGRAARSRMLKNEIRPRISTNDIRGFTYAAKGHMGNRIELARR